MAQFLLKMTLEQRDPCDSSFPNLGYTLQRWHDKASADCYLALQKYRNYFMFLRLKRIQMRARARRDEETGLKVE